ncbi:hypothetical protein [Celeribacter baekdonensis]|uniref:Uncharacterized protein n=1 Tax=Celeribacter baekdonensis TaxID=875171 RepID=A0A2R4M7U7_9RHOB|nr:hypothetical protein [Celeribacter baekdonensis]AVW93281.1 hypothetical protein DA792_21185 [Celeribacter baekdonensis]
MLFIIVSKQGRPRYRFSRRDGQIIPCLEILHSCKFFDAFKSIFKRFHFRNTVLNDELSPAKSATCHIVAAFSTHQKPKDQSQKAAAHRYDIPLSRHPFGGLLPASAQRGVDPSGQDDHSAGLMARAL